MLQVISASPSLGVKGRISVFAMGDGSRKEEEPCGIAVRNCVVCIRMIEASLPALRISLLTE